MRASIDNSNTAYKEVEAYARGRADEAAVQAAKPQQAEHHPAGTAEHNARVTLCLRFCAGVSNEELERLCRAFPKTSPLKMLCEKTTATIDRLTMLLERRLVFPFIR